jgi:hypothetical protein
MKIAHSRMWLLIVWYMVINVSEEPKYGDRKFPQNVGDDLPKHVASHPRRQYSTWMN